MAKLRNYKKKSTQYPTEKLIQAITGSGGIMSSIAQKLHCDWHTANSRIYEDSEALQALNDEREKIKDLSEGVLITAIKGGDVSSAKWYLTKQAKDRGYADDVVNNIQITNTSETAIDDIKERLDKLSPEDRDAYLSLCEKMENDAIPE